MHLVLMFEAVILTVGVQFINAHKDFRGPIKNVCGHETELYLPATGVESSVLLKLTATEQNQHITSKKCQLRIRAPETHIIYLRIYENSSAVNEEQMYEETKLKNQQPCPVRVYTTGNSANLMWMTDPCSTRIQSDDGSLLSDAIQLEFQPPVTKQPQLRDRYILATTLGYGSVCKTHESQYTCIQFGRTITPTLLCLSNELVCDGINHCPPSSLLSDENVNLCQNRILFRKSNYERLANEFMNILGKQPNSGRTGGSLLPAIRGKDNKDLTSSFRPIFNRHDIRGNYDSNSNSTSHMDSISSALAHYGPWGYLMLGMLICGVVLMFCGLWECCCRRTKPPTPTLAQASGVNNNPSTVLIISAPPLDADTQTLPRYEDLDQPPKYDALFPDLKSSTNTTTNQL